MVRRRPIIVASRLLFPSIVNPLRDVRIDLIFHDRDGFILVLHGSPKKEFEADINELFPVICRAYYEWATCGFDGLGSWFITYSFY